MSIKREANGKWIAPSDGGKILSRLQHVAAHVPNIHERCPEGRCLDVSIDMSTGAVLIYTRQAHRVLTDDQLSNIIGVI